MTPETVPALSTLARRCWTELARAAGTGAHPWRTPVVATGDEGGVSARTVVLRAALEDRRALLFHTDRRSDKAAQLARDDRVSWVFWDPEQRIQLRCQGRAACARGEGPASAAWADLEEHGRVLYRSARAPGDALSRESWSHPTGSGAAGSDGVPPRSSRAPAARDDGFEHFLLVTCTIDRMDWLWLGPDHQHRRARLEWAHESWRVTPVAP